MIDRIKVVGYQGFCLTVNSALYSRRERPTTSRWSVDNTRAPQHREWQAKVTWDDVVRMRDYAGLPFVESRHGSSAPVGRRSLSYTSSSTKRQVLWSHPVVSSSEAV
jgi:hypothetical protein